MANASLDANLAQTMGQQPDPFAQARAQFQQQRATDASMMQGAPMASGGPMAGAAMGGASPMAEPTIKQTQQPLTPTSFPDLASQHGIDTNGLSNQPQVGKLQLLQRMQSQFGPGFQQHPAFGPLMAAYDDHTADNTPSRAESIGAASKANRTLKALMGADPWS